VGTAAVAATSSQYGGSYSDPRSVLEVDAQCLVDKMSTAGVETPDQLQKCRVDSTLQVTI
jgi:hypothetical protein